MLKPWLYKLDANGSMRAWRVELETRESMDVRQGRYRTISGLVDGQHVTTGWVLAKANSLRDCLDQAVFEVDALYKRALKTDYHATEAEALKGPRHVEPMLCKSFDDCKPKVFGNITDWDMEPKLDGIRALLTAEGGFSRTGERFLTLRLIQEALADLHYADPTLILDGEIYNHAYHDRFNELSGLIRKGVNSKKPITAEDLAAIEPILQYHIYDVPSHDGTRAERRAFLESLDLDSPYLRLVESTTLTSREHSEATAERHLAEAYEGSVYKRRSAVYQRGRRPWDQLKRKLFETAEFPIVRVEEGEGDWKGKAKRIVFRWDDGREFGSGLRGSMEFAKKLYEEFNAGISDYMYATVRFMPPPQGCVPRTAVAIDFHGQEGRRD